MNKAALIMHKKQGCCEVDTYDHVRGEVVILQLENSFFKAGYRLNGSSKSSKINNISEKIKGQ